MKEMNSLTSEHVKSLVRLATDARERKQQQQFIAEGMRTCQTLIKSGLTLNQLYVTDFMLEKAEQLAPLDKVTIVSDAVLNKISPSSTPSGLLALFAMPQVSNDEPLASGLVLCQISDPGNMGTLIRTCAAMGKKTVVIIEGVDPFNPKVIQATAGTIGFVNIVQCTWQELMKRKKTLKLAGLVVNAGKPMHTLSADSLIVVGNEAHGLPTEYQKSCDELITLEMPGGTESLNAAIAGSIAMYVGWNS